MIKNKVTYSDLVYLDLGSLTNIPKDFEGTTVDLLTLNEVPVQDKLGLVLNPVFLSPKVLRLFAAQVFHLTSDYFDEVDNKAILAVDTAEQLALGRMNDDDRTEALAELAGPVTEATGRYRKLLEVAYRTLEPRPAKAANRAYKIALEALEQEHHGDLEDEIVNVLIDLIEVDNETEESVAC